MNTKPVKIKRSVLSRWRDQVLEDVNLQLECKYITLKGRELTENEKECYRHGLIRGWNTCASTLHFQKVIERIID